MRVLAYYCAKVQRESNHMCGYYGYSTAPIYTRDVSMYIDTWLPLNHRNLVYMLQRTRTRVHLVERSGKVSIHLRTTHSTLCLLR